jgi:hypothetical protein
MSTSTCYDLGTMPKLDRSAFRNRTANAIDADGKEVPLRYREDNHWCQWWKTPVEDADTAHALYERAADSELGFLLLGETKIRSDEDLVFNHGLTSHGGVQEKADVARMAKLNAQRAALGGASMSSYSDVVGGGSILSDRNWTPMHNDAFILGGIHTCQDFILAEDTVSQTIGTGRFQSERPLVAFQWKKFFQNHIDLLWGSWGAPRVFSRELIGLATFGYKPEFTSHQLGFSCRDRGRAQGATFVDYLDALSEARFGFLTQQGAAAEPHVAPCGYCSLDKASILAFVGAYMFDDSEAFAGL